MALKFMIIGLPRSGTTWAADWLSTDDCTVIHDPLYDLHYEKWNDRHDAVSCTGIWRWPAFVNAQPCPKIILLRPEHEVLASLGRMGAAGTVQPGDSTDLHGLSGTFFNWEALFVHNRARQIWEICHPHTPFNRVRWLEKRKLNIQPNLAKIHPHPDVTKRLLTELRKGAS